MWRYDPPLDDMRFTIEAVLDAPASWSQCPDFADCDAGMARQVLEQAGRFAAEVLAPTNAPGDLHGCRLEGGSVRAPPGFRDAYRAFVAAGWPALACDTADGGQGLPKLLDAALYEMLLSANHAWSMYPGLLHGAYRTLKRHASPPLRERYLPHVVSGEWLVAMALTEPQAGSDLGLVRTAARPHADGSVRIHGTKIFISGGDHDLTDDLVHLVLCRLPDAPAGTRGLSLALVPRNLPDGTRNAMSCAGLERKMGIHGSATCVMNYDGATGWLVGEPNRGLAAMFVMMNAARLHVGLQGLGHLEMASQNALRYAHERLQMRAARRADGPQPAAADPIARHPAMRRTLLGLAALTQGLRIVAYWCAVQLDEADHHHDAARRERAARFAGLLTPVVKAFLTHHGFQGANAALQVWGGYGYLRDYGIEQCVRDARIALIYEGTNEIQAIDLLMRTTIGDGGAGLTELLDVLAGDVARCEADPALALYAAALKRHCDAARDATAALARRADDDPEWPLRVADDFLMGLGYTLLAWAWARMAIAARADPDAAASARRLASARFGTEWLLPDGERFWQRAANRDARLPDVPD
jgi:alkylation response protein AidB-like acyl-CoA dehydrogenase